MSKHVEYRNADERRASVARIVAEAGGLEPKGVALIGFRKATQEDVDYADTIRARARVALGRGSRKIG